MSLGSRACTLAAVALISALGLAAPLAIGVAASESSFAAGKSTVRGQATLFEGDPVRSHFLATRLLLRDGPRYVLGIGSEGTIHRDYLALQSGSAELLHSGRVLAAGLNIAVAAPGSAATIYVSGKTLVTVMVRSGEIRVARVGGKAATSLRAGQVASIRPDARGALALDSQGALAEVSRVQADQVAHLLQAAQDNTCLKPRVNALSRTFADISGQVAGNQATRNVILARIDRGSPSPADVQVLNNLNNTLRVLERSSSALAADLNDVIFQHHPGDTPIDPSAHKTHEHSHPLHHGQHGHSVDPSGGHHAGPPHSAGLSGDGVVE